MSTSHPDTEPEPIEPTDEHVTPSRPRGKALALLSMGALGIVYGDIGTSPLYAFRESFEGHELAVNPVGVVGACSLVVWSLIIIISIKYLALVMRADNKGEGGILALTALLGRSVPSKSLLVMTTLGIFGTALLYGDGMITPAISVLSAVEGLEVAAPSLHPWIIPLSVTILAALFLVQRRGTAGIGRVFGPIMVVWFAVLALLGLQKIVANPDILRALNPIYTIDLFRVYGFKGFLALGSIFLVVTGGEALYADMGHFGRSPIRISWFSLVFPALVLNYLGQGALLLENPEAIDSPFFNLAPQWATWPLVLLATAATVIASQALISGAFSMTVQAMQLDYLPRVKVHHTSAGNRGQVYVPAVNWLLMASCIGLVVGFRTSGNLAAAYGIAVTMTMAITTLLFIGVARHRWQWSRAKAFGLGLPLLVIDLGFFAAQITKIPHGGWFALAIGLGQFTLMTTWRTGRRAVASVIQRGETPVSAFVDALPDLPWERVPGVSVFLFKDTGSTPPALLENVRHNKVLHETVLLLYVITADQPTISPDRRSTLHKVGPGIWQVELTFGFMDNPDVPAALAALATASTEQGLHLEADDLTYFLGRETIVVTSNRAMHPLREQIFVMQNRTAASAARFFSLPASRVFEVGTTVEI